MKIDRIDHIVLTVRDIENSIKFYTEILGMALKEFKPGRFSLHFGNQKINLHESGNEFDPKADKPTPGSADLCFIANEDINIIVKELKKKRVNIIEGPVKRTGAIGKITSIYFRDPDNNLVEVSEY